MEGVFSEVSDLYFKLAGPMHTNEILSKHWQFWHWLTVIDTQFGLTGMANLCYAHLYVQRPQS